MINVSGLPQSCDGLSKTDIMIEYFKALHPAVDIRSDEFKRDAKATFFANATELTDKNFETFVRICKDYIDLTGHAPDGSAADDRKYGAEVVTGVFACMHVTLFGLFDYGWRFLLEKLDRAFDHIINDNKEAIDIAKAEKIVTEMSAFGDDLIYILDRVVERYVDRGDNDGLFMNAALVLDLAAKAAHNMCVAAYERNDDVERTRWGRKRSAVYSNILYYRMLADVMDVDDKTKAYFSGLKNPILSDRTAVGLADLRLFAFCISKGDGMTARYLKHVAGNEKKHWYNLYRECVIFSNNAEFVSRTDVVGRYLCETVDELSTKRIMYHSIFFECIALEWAYKNGLHDIAEKIIGNGYDRYLELDSLRIIWQYDKDKFRAVIKELKTVCLYRHIAQTKPEYYTSHRHMRNLYGDDFCDDMVELMKAALAEIDVTDESDPRNHSNRNTPKWAK